MNGTAVVSVLETFSAGSPVTIDVRQFIVLDKNAKEEFGFVRSCYVDLFPAVRAPQV
jgi:hypothetical protein